MIKLRKTRLLMMSCLYMLMAVCAAAQTTIDKTTRIYVMHSSGKVLCKNGNNHAAIVSPDDPLAGKLIIIPLGDGYYNIAGADGNGFMQLEGQWNTYFRESNTPEEAKYSIESAGGNYVRLRNKVNGKCLGTDSTVDGSYAFSDKDGSSVMHLWYLSDDKDAPVETSSTSYVINPDARKQTIEGWGVSLCWWANMCGKWSDEKIDELVDWLVSPDGLNYNIFRYNIGGGDDPENRNCDPHHMGSGKGLRAEMEGFKDSSDGGYIWSRDEAQRKIMLKIREKRPDAIFEAFSNSCPYYMTYSGCCAGNSNGWKDNLKPEYYEEFAHYLVDVCKHYKDEYGIEFRTLDPFNEPLTNYWSRNGGQEGCHFDLNSQIAFLKVLSPILKESGLNTVISASDESTLGDSYKTFEGYRSAGVLDLIGQWNTHSYYGSNKDRSKIRTLSQESGLRLWMSETGNGGSGISGNLEMAKRLMNDVNYLMPAAWVDWQYVEEGNDQWCMVTGNFAAQTYNKVKNYYVRQQISRFIKAGYTILSVADDKVLAARNAAGDSLVIVAINSDVTPINHTVDLSFYESIGSDITGYITDETRNMEQNSDFSIEESKLTFKLPGLSIATFLIPVTVKSEQASEPEEGAAYMLLSRTAQNMAIGENESGYAVLNTASMSDDQKWTLKADGDNWIFENKNGNMLTYSAGEYYVSCTKGTQGKQAFRIENIDAPFCKIVTAGDARALDLEKESNNAGTRIGVWEYGTEPTVVHRQWLMMKMPEDTPDIPDNISSAESETENMIEVEDGMIKINDKGEGVVRIYSVTGSLIAEINTGSTTLIPMGKGIYAVKYSSAGATASKVVIIR